MTRDFFFAFLHDTLLTSNARAIFRNTNIDQGFELIYRDFCGSFVIFYILLPRLFERSSLKCFLKSVRWSVGHKFEKMTADNLPHVANIYLSCLYAMFMGLKISLRVESRLSISLPFLQEVTLIVAVVDASTEIVRNTWRSSKCLSNLNDDGATLSSHLLFAPYRIFKTWSGILVQWIPLYGIFVETSSKPKMENLPQYKLKLSGSVNLKPGYPPRNWTCIWDFVFIRWQIKKTHGGS